MKFVTQAVILEKILHLFSDMTLYHWFTPQEETTHKKHREAESLK